MLRLKAPLKLKCFLLSAHRFNAHFFIEVGVLSDGRTQVYNSKQCCYSSSQNELWPLHGESFLDKCVPPQ